MGRSRRVLFAFGVAAALPALVACNAILGIDDFRRTECGADPCELPDGGPDRIEPDNFVPDTGKDTGPDAPPGVDPVSWAQFPMPNYKLDSGAPTAPNPIAYSISGEQVTDTLTGLTWRNAVVGAPAEPFGLDRNQEAARAECAKITANGPWRLPKRIELVTLMSHGHGSPAIDTAAFANFPQEEVWTSSEVRPFAGKYWAIDFKSGELVQLDRSAGAKVLCVKAKQ